MTPKTALRLSLLLAAAPLFAPVAAFAQDAAPASTAAAPMTEGEKLVKLFADADEASLKRNPIGALFRGDMRYADQLGDYISDEYYAAEKQAVEDNLASLAKIDRAQLSATDQLAYDVWKRDQDMALKGMTPEIMALTVVRPVNHFSGFHTFWPTFSSAKGGAPYTSVADYENSLKRHEDYVKLTDGAIGRLRQGMDSGVVETKLSMTNVVAQLDAQLAQTVEESPFYSPILAFPESIGEADRTRLTAAYRDLVENKINPVHRRLRDFIANDYLPVAREEVGLSAMKGGATLYELMIEQTTTLPLKADEVHNLGLSEVARIRTEMETIKTSVGFEGTLKAFFDHIRSDPKFKPESREGLTQGYYAIGKTVDERIGKLFSTMPRSPLEIRPYEEFREKYEAGGSYQNGTPDGSRPGIFYFNAYDLPSRTTPGMTTLYLHEGAPGHHFQISLAQENTALPAFMRFGGNTAFVEGWALYAEKLGFDMQMFDDPYQRFGHLDDEMLRAMRLVVDTGLHSKGWTREQAIAYMLDNSGMGETDATAEVERYIAIPSQALAYKIGALTIQRLRARAEKELGAKFDIRAFHDQVLMTGALPMTVLEAKIDRWIAASK